MNQVGKLQEQATRTLRQGSFRLDAGDGASDLQDVDLDKDVYAREAGPAESSGSSPGRSGSFNSAGSRRNSQDGEGDDAISVELAAFAIFSGLSSAGFMIGSLAVYVMHEGTTGLPVAAITGLQAVSVAACFVTATWAMNRTCLRKQRGAESLLLGAIASLGLTVSILSVADLVGHPERARPRMLTGLSVAMSVVQVWFIVLSRWLAHSLGLKNVASNLVHHMMALDMACLLQGVAVGICSWLENRDPSHDGRLDIVATLLVSLGVFIYAVVTLVLMQSDERRVRGSSASDTGSQASSSPRAAQFYDFDLGMQGDPYAFHSNLVTRA